MPSSNPVEILLKHNRWANTNLLEAGRELPPELLNQHFEMGLGSLLNTIFHIVGAMQSRGDLLAGRNQRARLEAGDFDLAPIVALNEQVANDFESSVIAHPLADVLSGQRGGTSFSFTRSGVITQVATHGMHHRAQCLNMLRHLGVGPLPASSVADWMLMVDRMTD